MDGYFGQLGSPNIFPKGTRLIMDDIYDMEHETFYKQHACTLGTIDHYDKIMNMYIVDVSPPKTTKEIRKLRRELEKEMPPVYRVILVSKRSIIMFSIRRPKYRKDIAKEAEKETREEREMKNLVAAEHGFVDSGGTLHKEASPENIIDTRNSMRREQARRSLNELRVEARKSGIETTFDRPEYEGGYRRGSNGSMYELDDPAADIPRTRGSTGHEQLVLVDDEDMHREEAQMD